MSLAKNSPYILAPQEGPQRQFLSSQADVAIFGGAAGGGKTYALLLEPLRFINLPNIEAAILRRQRGGFTTTSCATKYGYIGLGR